MYVGNPITNCSWSRRSALFVICFLCPLIFQFSTNNIILHENIQDCKTFTEFSKSIMRKYFNKVESSIPKFTYLKINRVLKILINIVLDRFLQLDSKSI